MPYDGPALRCVTVLSEKQKKRGAGVGLSLGKSNMAPTVFDGALFSPRRGLGNNFFMQKTHHWQVIMLF